MEQYAVLAYRHDVPGDSVQGNNLPGRSQLFNKLCERDILPVVSQQAEAAIEGGAIQVHELLDDEKGQIGAPRSVALANVGVIINRLDRSMKSGQIQRNDLLPPIINENATRSLAFRKHRTDSEVLTPLGLSMPTTLVESAADIESFLEAQKALNIIVKPNSGTNSEGVTKLHRLAVIDHFVADTALYGEQIIQVAHDFSVPFPSALRAYDAASQEAFTGWSQSLNPKELRVYGFHSPAGTAVLPVARAIAAGQDNWFFVDPDSVPERVMEGTRAAMALTAKISGALAVYGTVDFGYGSDGINEPDWQAIELNGRMPYLLGYDKHPAIADDLRNCLANQIKAAADARPVVEL